jgi:hypothetical protein
MKQLQAMKAVFWEEPKAKLRAIQAITYPDNNITSK